MKKKIIELKPTIIKFDDKTGNLSLLRSFVRDDGILSLTDDEEYNVFDLIRENKKLKEEMKNKNQAINDSLYFIENNITETKYNYVYSNEINITQELYLNNEELTKLENILKNAK